jgi:hypothetical protein
MKWAVAAATAMALAVPASALGAAPGATTSPASAVTSTSASLNGTVSPNQENTTYHFDYGLTTSYGSKTPNGTVNGNKSKNVTSKVTGLAPSTTYHFRLVAVNASGTTNGADMSFKTAAPGTGGGGGANSVTISLRPSSVVFGHTTTITGQIKGSNAAGRTVTLQESPFPYTSFKNAANATTDSNGKYTFMRKPLLNTRYQVVAKTGPPTTSPVAQESVRFFVSLRLSDSTISSGQRVRFSGVIRPADNGGLVQIQRRTRSGWKTISKTLAKVSTTGQSKYAKKVRISTAGLYRVRVPGNPSYATGTSAQRRISF